MRKIRVRVTAKDITEGRRYDCTRCPIALAIQRRFPGVVVKVGRQYATINQTRVLLPERIGKAIADFDRSYNPMRPTSFEIAVEGVCESQ